MVEELLRKWDEERKEEEEEEEERVREEEEEEEQVQEEAQGEEPPAVDEAGPSAPLAPAEVGLAGPSMTLGEEAQERWEAPASRSARGKECAV